MTIIRLFVYLLNYYFLKYYLRNIEEKKTFVSLLLATIY